MSRQSTQQMLSASSADTFFSRKFVNVIASKTKEILSAAANAFAMAIGCKGMLHLPDVHVLQVDSIVIQVPL